MKLQDDLFGLKNKDEEITDEGKHLIKSGNLSDKAQLIYDELKKFGLRIPENVIVIGTINMDETTHQLSRKVVDRAMTIEMNLPEGKKQDGSDINPFMDFYDSSEPGYRETPMVASLYLPTEVSASEAILKLASAELHNTEWLKEEIANVLKELNDALEGTPFKIAYRVQNELVLYFYEQWRDENEPTDEDQWKIIFNNAIDQILMMKVLPRIEGDEDLLEQPLIKLAKFCEPYKNASKKIIEMQKRLEHAPFTSYWP